MYEENTMMKWEENVRKVNADAASSEQDKLYKEIQNDLWIH